MRPAMMLRLLISLLLLGGALAAPAVPALVPAAMADDDDGDDDRDDRDRSDDGWDDDQHDDGWDDDSGRGHDDRDDWDDHHRSDDRDDVMPVAAYQVDVTCELDDGNDTSLCTFAVNGSGKNDVSWLVIPGASGCADVVAQEDDDRRDDDDGDDDGWGDDSSRANLNGYRFAGDGPHTLSFAGTVTTSGTGTYWVVVDDEVMPATGPGLSCDAAATTGDGKGEAPMAGTGHIAIEIFTCPGIAAGMSGVDWFGTCVPSTGTHRYVLADDDDDVVTGTAETSTASTSFVDLPPGEYDLSDSSGAWCHAKSDNVDDDSDLRVVVGETTTVWLFYCD